jgi:hypothetical protein
MSAEKSIDEFLDDFIQLKVSLERLIKDCEEKILTSDEKTKRYRAIYILKNKYEMLQLISEEIRYLTADSIREIMS